MNMQVRSWDAFLFGVADGQLNSTSLERLLKLTAGTAARKGISKILIDGSRVTGGLSDAERVDIGERVADHINKLGPRLNVAIVGHRPTFSGLGVLAARGRGLNVMLFDNASDAIVWLKRGHVVSGGEAIHAASANA